MPPRKVLISLPVLSLALSLQEPVRTRSKDAMADTCQEGTGIGGGTIGHQHANIVDANTLDENNFVKQVRGNDQLEGTDQMRVRTQRHAPPGASGGRKRFLEFETRPSNQSSAAMTSTNLTRVQARSVAAAMLTAGLLLNSAAWGQTSSGSCSSSNVVVERGDTLSQIAGRCDVSERSILSANPEVEGSSDLQVGATLKLDRNTVSDRNISTKLNSFAAEANHALGRVARQVGSSVQDLLDKNPDLKSRLDAFGRQIGLSDSGSVANISVTPQSGAPGSTVTVSGTGLPEDSPVAIGVGSPGSAYEIVQNARTSAAGTLETKVQVPGWVPAGRPIVFVIRVTPDLHVRSTQFRVSAETDL